MTIQTSSLKWLFQYYNLVTMPPSLILYVCSSLHAAIEIILLPHIPWINLKPYVENLNISPIQIHWYSNSISATLHACRPWMRRGHSVPLRIAFEIVLWVSQQQRILCCPPIQTGRQPTKMKQKNISSYRISKSSIKHKQMRIYKMISPKMHGPDSWLVGAYVPLSSSRYAGGRFKFDQ